MKTSLVLIVAWLVCPAVFWFVLRRRYSVAKLGCLAYLAGYILLLVTVAVIGAELWHDMQSYDLNGDGMIMGVEETPAAMKAEREWSSDLGRNLAPVVGIPYVLIWYTLVIAVFWSAESIAKLFMAKDEQKDKTTAR